MDNGYVGILGGTFDPIHNAHIKLGQSAYEELGLDKVIFMPAYIPPHKMKKHITDGDLRLQMTKLAIEEYPYFEASDFELKLADGASYTARTLTLLSEEYTKIAFIVGADSFLQMDSWYHPEIIFSKATICCATRDNTARDILETKAKYFKEKYNGESVILNMNDTPISSTDIRMRLNKNLDCSNLLPVKVIDFIKRNGLYDGV